MTTTDHAIVAPAVTGDPGTRADAGGFDPGRREWRSIDTAPHDGTEVDLRNDCIGVPWSVFPWVWRHDGWLRSKSYPRVWAHDVLGPTHWRPWVDPAAPDPIPQPEGDAPPAPTQSAGAAADGEDDAALEAILAGMEEQFATNFIHCDRCSHEQHICDMDMRDDVKAARDILARRGARPHEPADASARSAARAWLHTYGIKTERYTSGGGDHPAMDTLPAAFEAFASARSARGEVAEAVLAEREACATAIEANALLTPFLRDSHVLNGAAALIRARPAPAAVLDRARPAGQGEGDGWLPIATAPKDGTLVDLWAQRDINGSVGRYTDCRWARRHYGTVPFGDPCWLGLDDTYSTCTPTHWRPLPVPPSAAAAPPAPASRATSAPAQDAGPAGVTEEMVEIALAVWRERSLITDDDVAMSEALEAAARARTPDAGKETGR